MLIPNPDLDFWNSDPEIHFWANLGPKTQSCSFCMKIGTHGISKMLILVPSVFWISNSNFLFGQIWAKNLKVVCFNWKLTHMVSWKCRFRVRTWIFEVLTPKFIFGQIWAKKVKVVQFGWKLAHSLSIMLIPILTLLFSVSYPKSFFGQIWAEKFKVVHFD